MLHNMCYSHLGYGVCNGAISITQQGFISGCYKVKSNGQWEKILVMTTGFVDHLGPCTDCNVNEFAVYHMKVASFFVCNNAVSI